MPGRRQKYVAYTGELNDHSSVVLSVAMSLCRPIFLGCFVALIILIL